MILFVEDNELVARVVRDTLKAEGLPLEICKDGATALKKIESGERFELLILDQELGGMTGLELLRRVRRLARHRCSPVIMFTASECEEEAHNAEADAFLRKPEDISKLTETIRRLIA